MCHDGEIWFSGVKGFNAFYPEDIKDNIVPPAIQITGMKVNDTDYKPENYIGEDSLISLPYSQRTVSFDFTGIEFSDAENVKLQYKMQGIDNNWIETKNPGFARYANLPPGKYLFQIKAANSDGVWNTQIKTMQLIIITPFFMTTWFYLLIVVLIAAVLYVVYRYRIAQILKLQMVRNRIARDLHDDIGSSLSSIRIMSDLVKNNMQKDPGKSAEMITKIGDESQQAMDGIRDIVWTVKPENDSLENICLRMQEYAAEMLESKNINYNFSSDESLKNIKLPMNKRRDLYLIFKEAINNLAKYSQCSYAEIKLSRNTNKLLLQVKDNGIGFEDEQIKAGNGLKNMKQRAAQSKGTLAVQTEKNKGTCILLEMTVT